MRRDSLRVLICVLLSAAPSQAQTVDAVSKQKTDTISAIAPAVDRVADELAKTRADQADPMADERNARERRDVVAQESMSTWTFWMAVAVFFQTLLAGGALWALILDLRQSRKSSEAQIRAYISIKNYALHTFSDGKGGATSIRLDFEIWNGGQSPAYNCSHMGNLMILSSDEAAAIIGEADGRTKTGNRIPYVVHIGEHMSVEISSAVAFTKEQVDQTLEDRKSLYVFGLCEYQDAFGKQKYTEFCMRLVGPLIASYPMNKITAKTDLVEWDLMPFHNNAT